MILFYFFLNINQLLSWSPGCSPHLYLMLIPEQMGSGLKITSEIFQLDVRDCLCTLSFVTCAL